jgi:hypothetical protein
MKVFNKIALIAVVVAVITNPLSGSVILTGLDKGFRLIFLYGSPVNLAASVIIGAWIGWQLWITREKVEVPKKGTKTKKDGLKYELT